jgi:hypothetical protein
MAIMFTRIVMLIPSILIVVTTSIGLAQTFDLSWYTVDGGGAMFTAGGNLELSGTIGQPDAGGMTGGTLSLTGGFWSAAPAGASSVPGDCDDDGDVDLADYGDFASCLSGPLDAAPSGCECSHFDADSDIDLRDLAEFQVVFTD